MKKLRYFLLILAFLQLMSGGVYAAQGYQTENYKIFQGFSDTWGWKAWAITTKYSITVDSYATDKAVIKHSTWAHAQSPLPEAIGNGSYALLSSIVYENSNQLRVHNGSTFNSYSYISDPNWKVYIALEKNSSDVMNINSYGRARAGFMFFNNSFTPINSWNNELDLYF